MIDICFSFEKKEIVSVDVKRIRDDFFLISCKEDQARREKKTSTQIKQIEWNEKKKKHDVRSTYDMCQNDDAIILSKSKENHWFH